MDYITNNPYRVLGVFANDSARVRTANIARIRAFRKVGKECSFDCDFVDLLGPVDRSEEAVDNAISQLSFISDEEFYSCFWFSRTSELNLKPNAPVDIIRSCINREEREDYANVAVAALLSGNNALAAEYYIKLFNVKLALIDAVKEKVLIALNDGSYCGEKELPLGWWYKFRNATCYVDDLEQIGKVFSKEAIKYLRSVTDNKIFKDEIGVTNLLYCHSLAKIAIDVLLETSDPVEKEPNAEAQLAFTDYVKVMISLCHRVCDTTRFWDAKPVNNLIVLLEKLCDLSYSDSVKDDCTDFIEELNDEVKYLAPSSVQTQSSYIRKKVESFCEKPSEAHLSVALIHDCVQSLKTIKESLGRDNLYYRRVSTRIADNALYACQCELDSAERKYDNKDNDLEEARKNLTKVLKLSLQLSADISQLDLEELFRDGKLKDFSDRLTDDLKQYHIQVDTPVSSVTMKTHDEIYESCNDYQSLKNFTAKYPDSPHIGDAFKRIWEIEDNAYPKLGTSVAEYRKSLLAYKEKYPNSHNDNKLLKELNDLLLGSSLMGTVYDYRTFLRLWPDHPRKTIILGRLDLAVFKMCRNISDWEDYLKTYPNGQHREEAMCCIKEAQEKIEKDAYDKCVTITDCQNFIRKYPSSKLCRNARLKIERLVYEDAVRTGNYQKYYTQYPSGTYVNVLREMEDDNMFKSCNTISDYKKYLKQYPYGLHAEYVHNKLNDRMRRNIIVGFLIIAVISLICALIFSTKKDSPKTNNRFDNSGVMVGDTAVEEEIVADTIVYETPIEDNDDEDIDSDFDYLSRGYGDSEPSLEDKINEAKTRYLYTGATPYRSELGAPITGDNYFKFETSRGSDYIVLVRRTSNDRYMGHVYIRGGETASIYLPDGYFTVYFYSGIGWNSNKRVGSVTGGFDYYESFQKDEMVELYSATVSYTLYPVKDGNLSLDKASADEIFD